MQSESSLPVDNKVKLSNNTRLINVPFIDMGTHGPGSFEPDFTVSSGLGLQSPRSRLTLQTSMSLDADLSRPSVAFTTADRSSPQWLRSGNTIVKSELFHVPHNTSTSNRGHRGPSWEKSVTLPRAPRITIFAEPSRCCSPDKMYDYTINRDSKSSSIKGQVSESSFKPCKPAFMSKMPRLVAQPSRDPRHVKKSWEQLVQTPPPMGPGCYPGAERQDLTQRAQTSPAPRCGRLASWLVS